MEVTRNLKQAKPNELDSHFRGNDGMQVRGNDGMQVRGNDGMQVRGNDGMQVRGNDGMQVRGNDEVEVTRNLKQAKLNEPDSHFRGNDGM